MKVLNLQKRSVELFIKFPTLKLKPKWNQTRLTTLPECIFLSMSFSHEGFSEQIREKLETIEKYTLTSCRQNIMQEKMFAFKSDYF